MNEKLKNDVIVYVFDREEEGFEMSVKIKEKKKNLQFIMTLPACSKCDKKMNLKTRTITCGFHNFIGVTDLVCICGYIEENVFDMRCE